MFAINAMMIVTRKPAQGISSPTHCFGDPVQPATGHWPYWPYWPSALIAALP